MEFLKRDNYTKEVEKLLKDRNKIDCAIAFWGGKSIERMEQHKNKNSRLICNLESGATNPKAITELMKSGFNNFRSNEQLHAKVIIGKDKTIIGSANITANGLSYEDDELNGWIEAGILLDNTDLINNNYEKKEISNWFEVLWNGSRKIDKKMIKKATIKWNKRRKANVPKTASDGKSEDIQKWVFIANPDNYDWNTLQEHNELWLSHDDGVKRKVRNGEPLKQIQRNTIVIGYQSSPVRTICALGIVYRNTTTDKNDICNIPVKKAFNNCILRNPISFDKLKENEILRPVFSNLQLTYIKLTNKQYIELKDLILLDNPELATFWPQD